MSCCSLPGVHLSEAHERISADLTEKGVRCVVVDDTVPRHDSGGGDPSRG